MAPPAAQYSPAPPQPRRRRRGVVGPLVLIFLGGIFLLQNVGYLPPNYWLSLWRLWPLVLVLAGIELLLAGRIPWLALFGVSVITFVVGALALNNGDVLGPGGPVTTVTESTDLGGARQASVTIAFDAGELNIASIQQPTPTQLATMTYTGPDRPVLQPRYTANGERGQLELTAQDGPSHGFVPFFGGSKSTPHLDLGLNPQIPITALSIKSGASTSKLDLSALKVSDFEMSIGAAGAWIRLPQAAGATTARISGGASDVTIEVPPGVAARIRTRVGLSTVNVGPRFPASGDRTYQSADFGSNPNSVDITIDAGFAKVQVS